MWVFVGPVPRNSRFHGCAAVAARAILSLWHCLLVIAANVDRHIFYVPSETHVRGAKARSWIHCWTKTKLPLRFGLGTRPKRDVIRTFAFPKRLMQQVQRKKEGKQRFRRTLHRPSSVARSHLGAEYMFQCPNLHLGSSAGKIR